MFETMKEIKAANRAAGQFYFSESTMAFFDSRIESDVIGGRYFVTSEKGPHQRKRLYTVRVANDDATIDTVGDFQMWESLIDARVAALLAANGRPQTEGYNDKEASK